MNSAGAGAVAHYREIFAASAERQSDSASLREAAFARFTELGFPGPREESWKYTPLRRLEARRFVPALREHATQATPSLPEPLAPARLVLINGFMRADLSSNGSLPPGIRISAAGANTADHVRLLRVPCGGGTERFAALNAALCPEPLLIEVDEDVICEGILHIVTATVGDNPVMAHPRIAIRLATGSRLRIILHHFSTDESEHFTNQVLDAEVAENAQLHVYRFQDTGARGFHIERCDATVAAGGCFVLRDAQLGGSLARLDVNVALQGGGAETEITGLFLADGSRHLDTHLQVDHQAMNAHSLQDYRGIAANRGRAVFNSKVIVHPGAQKSVARQSSRNLLLTPGAEIDTKPELEIHADDVQCSHGATTGQLDPAAMFYLRSRGFSTAEARSALTRAFTGAVMSRMDHDGLATLIREALNLRLVNLLESNP